MAVKININKSAVVAKIDSAWGRNLYILSSEILADCNQYCKVDQTILRKSSMIHSKLSEGKLIWQTPYARRQYWEIKTALTPGTTWKWCETAKRKHKAQWTQLANKLVKG